MIIDKDDVYRVQCYKWSSQGKYLRINRHWDGIQHNIYLHHFLIGMPLNRTLEVDHINRDVLDNRKCNLRFVSRQMNMKNKKPALGIYWDRDRNNWVAQGHTDTTVYLGSYKKRAEALIVYNNWKTKKEREEGKYK